MENQISKFGANIKELKTKVPAEGLEKAKTEYDNRNSLWTERDIVNRALWQAQQYRPKPGELAIPPSAADIKSLADRLSAIRAAEKTLNQSLISQYEEYQSEFDKLQRAERDLSDTRSQEIAEKRKYSYFNFVYFSTVTMATVGYGDITPKTRSAKMLVTLENLLGGALVLVYLTLVLGDRGKEAAIITRS